MPSPSVAPYQLEPTVARVADAATVRDALDAGADAFTHVPLDAPLSRELVERAAAEGRVVTPTLAMMEVSSGADVGRALADDDRIAAWLHRAGARLPAGTDANNALGECLPNCWWRPASPRPRRSPPPQRIPPCTSGRTIAAGSPPACGPTWSSPRAAPRRT
ncbi:hypothetical protein [Streptomyces sp. DSM 15324]|uniref:hypothetical protein n=1 Tax=Streptomyces sp. DSM 15324 TaxID=1739111 RepID=UPI0007495C77|nr:hypothetical protein [Streptomyces sp. DSM 15324]KUO09885.1 hypothetical protein AQJ58_22870 [Streptomyces sp. DSM 15324]